MAPAKLQLQPQKQQQVEARRSCVPENDVGSQCLSVVRRRGCSIDAADSHNIWKATIDIHRDR